MSVESCPRPLHRVGDDLGPGQVATYLTSSLSSLSPPAASVLDFFSLALDALMRESGFTRLSEPSRGQAGKKFLFEYRLLARWARPSRS